jgi:Fur family transcriptional regulator, ferric uptake regulator
MICLQESDNKEFFTSQGIKNTKQRNLIFDVLKGSDLPLTAEQIFLELKDIDASINLSTVYRILDVYVSKGIALKIGISDGNKTMFELNRMEHKHHLVCVGCKKMISVDGCPFEEYEKVLQSKMGFDVTGHKLEIFGYCKECKLENTLK